METTEFLSRLTSNLRSPDARKQIGYLLDHFIFRRFGIAGKESLAKCNDEKATGSAYILVNFTRPIR
jgi:hypothetical protein